MNEELVPLYGYRSAYYVRVDPPSVILLDRHAWLVLELIRQNADVKVAEERYVARLTQMLGRAAAQSIFRDSLERLRSHGLVDKGDEARTHT